MWLSWLVGCGGGDAGSQEFEVAAAATVLSYGETHLGAVAAGERQAFVFDAEVGDVVSAFVTTVPRGGDAELELALHGAGAVERAGAHLIDHAVMAPGKLTLVLASDTDVDVRLRLSCRGACDGEPIITPDGDCDLSPLGERVLAAASAAEQSRNTVTLDEMVSYQNQVGDALVTGPMLFPAMADAIALAEHEVDLAMFVYDHSDAYEEMTDALARLASRRAAAGGTEPVIVRIVVDAQRAFFNTGPEVVARVYQGIAELRLDPNHVQVMIATYEHFALGNLHTKLLVVDGRVTMLGGANIQPQHDYAQPWMDAFFALDGAAAQTALADFDHAWNESRKWHCDDAGCVRWDDAPPIWHPAAVLAPPHAHGRCAPAIALNRTAWGGFNNNIDNPMVQGILAAIDHASKRIRIQTPNLNDDALRDALVGAVARGVEVEALLSLGFNDTAQNFFGGTNEEVAADLLARVQAEAPAHAHLLRFRWYSHDGIAPIDGNLPHASHLKYMSIDDQMAIVGSTNMDTIAWNHSRETNLALDSAAVTRAWDEQVFVPNWIRAIW
jgi:phosphatidylserine/phosphatidylglycerophosphate/cardiolipin synthase-like enzyme